MAEVLILTGTLELLCRDSRTELLKKLLVQKWGNRKIRKIKNYHVQK
jgi:hypothetical protein